MSSLQAIHPHPARESKDGTDTSRLEVNRETDTAATDTHDPTDIESAPRLMLPRIRIDAFVASDELGSIVDRIAEDRRAARAEIALHRGGFEYAMELYSERPPADLILIEDHGSAEELEWNIEALADYCPPSSRLVVIGTRNDIALYRRLTRIGVSDYLVQPIRPLDLLGSILSIFGDSDQNELGIVLAFVGTRGGAGASTVAHNVAASLSGAFEATTLLIDADAFGTAALQFDISSPQGFVDALREGEALDGEMLDRLVHWRDKRLGVLAAPERPDGGVEPGPGSLRHLVEQARRLAQFVILDLPHGWTPWIAEALSSSDRIGVVGTPDLPSLRNCRALLDMIQKLRPNDVPPEIVLNRVPLRGKPAVTAADYARILERKIINAIPFDAAATSAEMSGRVLIEGVPGSPAATSIRTLAASMAGRNETIGRKGTSRSLIKRLFRGKRP